MTSDQNTTAVNNFPAAAVGVFGHVQFFWTRDGKAAQALSCSIN